jgi:hypothetical protein
MSGQLPSFQGSDKIIERGKIYSNRLWQLSQNVIPWLPKVNAGAEYHRAESKEDTAAIYRLDYEAFKRASAVQRGSPDLFDEKRNGLLALRFLEIR